MAAPPQEGREPGTRPDGEALPPQAIDPAPTGTPESDEDEKARMVKDATGF